MKFFMARNRYILIGLLAGAFFIGLLYFSLDDEKGFEADSGYRLIMGTFGRVRAIAGDSRTAQRCIEAALGELKKVETLMSDYKADSEISKVNKDGFKQAVQVSESTFAVLQKSIEYSRLTEGAFDITVGPLVDLFRDAEKKAVTVSDDEIVKVKSKVGFAKLRLDEQNRAVKFDVEGMRLDLGGIAKGYGIDKAIEAMQGYGAIGGMVDVGGDVRCFGEAPKSRDNWLIGLQDPGKAKKALDGGQPLLVLKLIDAAIATSGDYQRFFVIEGKKYSHIIDTTNDSGSDELTSVTIICEKAIDADVLATAVSVMRTEKGLALVESTPETEAILVRKSSDGSKTAYELIKSSGVEKFINRKSYRR